MRKEDPIAILKNKIMHGDECLELDKKKCKKFHFFKLLFLLYLQEEL